MKTEVTRSYAVIGLVNLLVCCGNTALAQERVPQQTEKQTESQHYLFKEEHDRNGIGKFYMGREIARVMSFHGADWLERDSREEEEKLSILIKSLKLKAGMTVADIGAGTGVISVLMAEQVGPEGKVLAVDIQQEMLDLLKKKTEQLGIRNIKPIQGTVKSPKLPAESVDLALFVDVYHEMAFPFEMMMALSKAIKPGGRIVLVEYRKEDPAVPIKLLHKMTEKQVKKELTQREFSLKWKETIGVLPRQHIVVFEKLPAEEKPGQ